MHLPDSCFSAPKNLTPLRFAPPHLDLVFINDQVIEAVFVMLLCCYV